MLLAVLRPKVKEPRLEPDEFVAEPLDLGRIHPVFGSSCWPRHLATDFPAEANEARLDHSPAARRFGKDAFGQSQSIGDCSRLVR